MSLFLMCVLKKKTNIPQNSDTLRFNIVYLFSKYHENIFGKYFWLF